MTGDSVEFRAVTAADAAAVREFVAGIGATDLTVLDDQLLDRAATVQVCSSTGS